MKKHQSHPAANIFPLNDRGPEFQGLAEDIKRNGLRHPIVLHDGKILDGRRRYLACRKMGVSPKFSAWDGKGSAVDYVISVNVHRRHLNKSQLAVAALRLLPMLEAEAKDRQRLSNGRGKREAKRCATSKGKATAQAAKRVGCSARYVEWAKKVQSLKPNLIAQVDAGKLSIKEAHEIVLGETAGPTRMNGRTMPVRAVACAPRSSRRKIIPASVPSDSDPTVEFICGDALIELQKLSSKSCHSCVTSIPFFLLRDYGVKGQYGLEETVGEWVARHVAVFREVRRVLRDDGTLWMNVADSYVANASYSERKRHSTSALRRAKRRAFHTTHLQRKCLFFAPQRLAIALAEDGWIARAEIILEKDNVDGCKDRPVRTHEYVYLFSKRDTYYYDADALRVDYSHNTSRRGYSTAPRIPKSADYDRTYELHPDGKLRGSIWRAGPATGAGDHPAPMPLPLAVDCVVAGCPEGGTVLDPFVGSGTTAVAAVENGRHCVGIDLSKNYLSVARKRLVGAKITTR